MAIGNEECDAVAAAAGAEKSSELKFLTMINSFGLKLLRDPLDRLIDKPHSDPPNRSRSKDAVSKV